MFKLFGKKQFEGINSLKRGINDDSLDFEINISKYINDDDRKDNSDSIYSLKKLIKDATLEFYEGITNVTEKLETTKDADIKDNKELYTIGKNILLKGLYEYYFKLQILDSVLSFSQKIAPLDIPTIRKINLKVFVNQLKKLHKKNYEAITTSLKDEYKNIVKDVYEQFEKDFNGFVNFIINIQSDIIIQKISPIEQNTILEKIKNEIGHRSIMGKYLEIDKNWYEYLKEYYATTKTICIKYDLEYD